MSPKKEEPESASEKIEKSILASQDGPDAPTLFLVGPDGPVLPLPAQRDITFGSFYYNHLEGTRLRGHNGPVLMLSGMAGRSLIPAKYLRNLAKALEQTADLFDREIAEKKT